MAGRALGLVPARGGSASIPRKSIALLAGRPLIEHTLAAAAGATTLDRVVVSTDDDVIADVARAVGAEVPFMRPPELATDDTPMIDVIVHALDTVGGEWEHVVLLQPTSPLRTAGHIDAVVELARRSGADTAVSVVRVPHQFTPTSVFRVDGERLMRLSSAPRPTRRQDKPVLFAPNGPAVLCVRVDVVRAGALYGEHVVGHEMSMLDSIDIDEPDDLVLAGLVLRARAEASPCAE